VRASLLGIAAFASLFATALGSAAPTVNGLTINVVYSSTSLTAKLSNGTVLSSGTVVPPGSYSVVVYDSEDSDPQFTMTGPGASVSSDLSPNNAGIESPVTFGPFVLEPSSSYAIFDANMAGGPHITFTTSATGTSASPDAPSSTAGSGSTKSSAATKSLASLALFVGLNGKPLLTQGGKPVKQLKAGSYSVIVSDSSHKAGLLLGHGAVRPSTLSGVAAVGTAIRSLKLTAGRWFYEASAAGPKTYFTVG
jgi:hypothetical protein